MDSPLKQMPCQPGIVDAQIKRMFYTRVLRGK